MADKPITKKGHKWPWMNVSRVANGFIVHAGMGQPYAAEAQYVFNKPEDLGKWIAEHAGDKG